MAVKLKVDKQPIDNSSLWEVSVIITEKNSKPAVELRSMTTDLNLIKTLVSAAYYGRPVIIMPKFTSTMQSLSTCLEKGILYKEGNDYFFTI